MNQSFTLYRYGQLFYIVAKAISVMYINGVGGIYQVAILVFPWDLSC